MDNMFSSSGGESPRQGQYRLLIGLVARNATSFSLAEVHLQHQDIEFISQLKPASIMVSA